MTVAALPRGLGDAFHLAAGELGLVSASWHFVREIAESGGEPALAELRDLLGRAYPVLDAVVLAWMEGRRGPKIELDPVLAACGGATQIVVVGLETRFLDALVARLPEETRLVLVEESSFEPDWMRVRANFGDRMSGATLSTFQRHAGRSSALVTFGYGFRGDGVVYVAPAWLRVIGGDVRTQFRSIVLWNVLEDAPFVYPRWLADAPIEDFTEIL